MTKPGVHPVDQGLPAGRLTLLGLQHMSIMYAGSVAVPLIVGSALKLDNATIALLVNADLLVAGIATLVQAVGIGKLLWIKDHIGQKRLSVMIFIGEIGSVAFLS